MRTTRAANDLPDNHRKNTWSRTEPAKLLVA